MLTYEPPLRDMQFVIDELVGVRKDWAEIPRFAGLDADTAPQILEAAGKFAMQTIAPTNSAGDTQGCRFDAGVVRTPDGFVGAYRRFCEAGWPALACDEAWGGQGLPQILNAAFYEMLNATNHGWTMYPGLAHAAYECLRAHASNALQEGYLRQIVSGEWLTTMCLTESQAGSDVGLIRTRAELRGDGSYGITGSKVFISGGEHDLTPNIVHLVLARLPGAPAGTRGISLFLVPKQLTTPDGTSRNSVRCDGIEKKMGIKGSATCVMIFEDAQGWLIGEPNRGLSAMFVMMNAARLYVGLQGLGHAEAAYQNALRYANERVQMRAVVKPDDVAPSHSGADRIIFQPAVRKTLMTLRAFVEGERALGLWSAHLLDIAEFHPNSDRRAEAHDLLSVLTPVIKSFFTENGFALSSAALQVWGGYGYVHDYGIEQSVRDSRIAMIYEGTNEIQAVDLLVRKIITDGGQKFELLLRTIREEAALCEASPACEGYAVELTKICDELSALTLELVVEFKLTPELAYRIAGDYLRLLGLVLVGTLWARAARICVGRDREPFYGGKLATARFYFDYLMPETRLRLDLIQRRARPLPWVDAQVYH